MDKPWPQGRGLPFIPIRSLGLIAFFIRHCSLFLPQNSLLLFPKMTSTSVLQKNKKTISPNDRIEFKVRCEYKT